MKAGQIYKQFNSKGGKVVTLRAVRWEDLNDLLNLANEMVEEREVDPDLGIILDKHQTLESEGEWLGKKLVAIESGREISVASEIDGKLVGNSEVARGYSADEFHHGKLGIAILKGYRNQGIGLEMMKTLVSESRKAGLKTVELEVFATNERGIHVYEKVGFKQVGKIPRKILRRGRFTDIIVMAIDL